MEGLEIAVPIVSVQRDISVSADDLGTLTADLHVMFFLYELERVITLHPSFFGPRVKEYLTNRLLEDVEGTCTGQYYIICVMDAYDISEGRVIPGSAVAEYTVHYRAVVWRPFKGETVRFRT